MSRLYQKTWISLESESDCLVSRNGGVIFHSPHPLLETSNRSSLQKNDRRCCLGRLVASTTGMSYKTTYQASPPPPPPVFNQPPPSGASANNPNVVYVVRQPPPSAATYYRYAKDIYVYLFSCVVVLTPYFVVLLPTQMPWLAV
jgi:hypothetical protein